jgi:hypothetical protein
VQCAECDYVWIGNRYAESTPKWVKDLFEIIEDTPASAMVD